MDSIIENDINQYTKKRKNIILFFSYIIFITFNYVCFTKTIKADGWTQNKKHGIIIGSIETKRFNGVDSIGVFDKNKHIHQTLFNLYGEYGITNKITLGAKVILVDSMQMKKNTFLSNYTNRSFALDTTQFFLKYGIIKNKTIALSVAGQVGLPSFFKKNEVSYFSIQKWNIETRIEIGVNFNKKNFATLTAGYHANIDHFYDEIRIDLMYGIYVDKVLFMAKLQKYFYIINKKKNHLHSSYISNISIYDYLSQSGFAKFNLSLAFPVDKNLKVEFGFYTSLKTKLLFTKKLDLNLKGIYVSLWYEF